jgi:oxygen-dependent protoporphyrinogen oxidase
MHVRRHVSLIETPLRPFTTRPLLSQCRRCRRYASSVVYPENIAILGGGITGLASAHFISKEFPKSKITVYEAGKETGGWVKSRKVDVAGGEVLFEYGPRTLRPGIGALPTTQLVRNIVSRISQDPRLTNCRYKT